MNNVGSLRSPGAYSNSAAYAYGIGGLILGYGGVDYDGDEVVCDHCVRPALWIEI